MEWRDKLGLRFILVGYWVGRGYAVKDLLDNCVEYFNKEKLLEISKIVKIQGVEGNDIDLNWFDTYYAKVSMTLGVKTAVDIFGLVKIDDKFVLFIKSGLFKYSLDFIEFVEDIKYYVNSRNGNSLCNALSLITPHLVKHNSSLFHLKYKLDNIKGISLTFLNSLNIQNILMNNAVVEFSDDSPDFAIVEKLKMHGINYKFIIDDCILLCNIPNDVMLYLSFSNSNASVYIMHSFDMSRVSIFGSVMPVIYCEDSVDKLSVANAFSKGKDRSTVLESIKRCEISWDNNVKSWRVDDGRRYSFHGSGV